MHLSLTVPSATPGFAGSRTSSGLLPLFGSI